MALTRWLKPGELAELGGWDLWRLREVGGWGDAGRIVGLRWEEVGGTAAIERFGECLIPLWRDKALGRWLGTVGLPNADAILVEHGGDGGLTLRPIDLKWTIDTAEYAQIAGETLRRLIEKAGARLTGLFPGTPERWRYGDGLFVAPDRPLNHLFLRSASNRKREYPIERREVVVVGVEPGVFYSPLPGWALARRLAELERTDVERDFETADRYYFLAVGIRGALLAAARSLFAERDGGSDEQILRVDADDDARSLAAVERLIADRGARTARDLARQLGGAQAARQELRAQLRGLERSPYRYPDFASDARKAGLDVADTDEAATAALRLAYRDLSRDHAQAVRARGRAIVATGASEQAALETLRAESDRFKREVRARAREALRDLMAAKELA
jgi:hypothetical protein